MPRMTAAAAAVAVLELEGVRTVFGVPGAATAESKEKFAVILAAIETNRVPLSALWVFDFTSQARDWNVTATNSRSWQLDAIQQANERMRTRR